jgi:hypothetical protein
MCAGNGLPVKLGERGGDRRGGPQEGPARRGVPHKRRSGARGRGLRAGGTIGRELFTPWPFRRPDDAGCRL